MRRLRTMRSLSSGAHSRDPVGIAGRGPVPISDLILRDACLRKLLMTRGIRPVMTQSN